MKFTLVLYFFAGLGENAVSLTTVEGFSTEHSCKVAGQILMQNGHNSPSYSQRFVCVPVN